VSGSRGLVEVSAGHSYRAKSRVPRAERHERASAVRIVWSVCSRRRPWLLVTPAPSCLTAWCRCVTGPDGSRCPVTVQPGCRSGCLSLLACGICTGPPGTRMEAVVRRGTGSTATGSTVPMVTRAAVAAMPGTASPAGNSSAPAATRTAAAVGRSSGSKAATCTRPRVTTAAAATPRISSFPDEHQEPSTVAARPGTRAPHGGMSGYGRGRSG
jgi:hypothetical protein